MNNGSGSLESFEDAQAQALFDRYLPRSEPSAEAFERITLRVLAEVQSVYHSPVVLPAEKPWHLPWLDRLAALWSRPLLVASTVVAIALLVIVGMRLVAFPIAGPSLAATVQGGEAVVLHHENNTYSTHGMAPASL